MTYPRKIQTKTPTCHGSAALRLLKRFSGLALLVLMPALASASSAPVAFGTTELNHSFSERGITPIRFETKISGGHPGSYTIQPGQPVRITGGDERGLMYGLLAAAEQIRTLGHFSPEAGSPHTEMRGIRYFLANAAMEKDWYYSKEYWDDYFRMLAYNRFNRFNLVFGSQTAYLVPPYPYLVSLPEFPQVQVPSLTPEQREQNLQMLKYISQDAADHGIDFALGLWEQNVWPGMKASVQGITAQNIGPYTYAALKKILQLCPAIRSIQIRANSESGIPKDQQLKFYNTYFFPAIHDAGRPVILDLRAWLLAPGMLDAVEHSGIPVRISAKYWAEFLGRPYQPAETWPEYSYLDLLQKPRPYQFYWELWGVGSNRLLLWGDPNYVRRAVSTFGLGDAEGFEIDPPLALKGFGNGPEPWGIFTESQKQRVFWKWEYQRYWLFYMLWGRLSYDPHTPDSLWRDELRKRFGDAAPQVLEAYMQASRVMPEIVAAHLSDPNLYLWPEVNPGGLIDDYIDIRPSDWRYIASIPDAVQNELNGTASAKQTPTETSELLDSIAAKIAEAVDKAKEKIGSGNKEWESSEPDFEVLELMARYHARKMLAADHLEYFYKTADGSALEGAKNELQDALTIWESLVHLTDGVYPEQMIFGPDDFGDWKDRLPYVQFDLQLIKEREDIFKRFGHFDYGFDFGDINPIPRGQHIWPYRFTHYVDENNVEPRFTAINGSMAYTDMQGYGWLDDASRETVGIPLSPYLEIRSAAKNPQHLPNDVLFRDYVRGEGEQRFRVDVSPGEYKVSFLHPDRSVTTASLHTDGDSLVIPFPQGSWSVSGLILQGSGAQATPPPEKSPKQEARPGFSHVPSTTVEAGKPLTVTLEISPSSSAKLVRLYYRPVDQLADFKVLEASPAHATFTIPGADISSKWDLMYYFEVLNDQNSGWFVPDPAVTTPYYVVKTNP